MSFFQNSQELPEPPNKIIMMLKENMNQISTIQTSLMEIKNEIQSIMTMSKISHLGKLKLTL